MAEVKSHKVKQLSSRLDPNAIYWVQASANLPIEGFITDINGVPYPLKDLQGTSGITGLTNTDGNLVITGADNKVINLAPALLSIINSALQSGDNVSELLNDAGYITSSSLPVNTSDLVNDGEDGTSVYVEQDDLDLLLQKKQNLPTGFITGLQLSINADPTKIDIAPGAYAISDFSDLENITVQIIQITNPITGITPAYLNTGNISYIALDANQGVIQSSSPFTNEQRRTLAILGAAIHSNLINVNVVNEIKAPIVAPTNQLHDLIRAIGSFNLEGNIYSANGVNLQLDKSAGTVFGLGINANNYLNPHQLNIASQTGLTFRYRLQNSFEYSDRTTIDPANYDNGGVLTPLLNNNKWQVQRINLFQSGLTRIQPGQHQYDTLEDAEANIKVESFVTETNIAENAIFRSYLIVKKNATDLSNLAQAKFIPVDKFGNVITGNTALTYANIVSALGYTPENVANKATDFTTINDTLYPSVEAVKEQLDLKLDKVSTAGVERAYIINADGSQGTKATSDFGGGVKTESVTISNRWTLTNADVYYRSRGDFGGFNVDTLNISTTQNTIINTVASLGSAFYATKASKSLDKIYVDGSSMTATLTSFKLGVFAFQRDSTATINTSAINIINLGEFTLTKVSGNATAFWEVSPTNIEIPSGYLVSCVLMRNGGTGTEVNCNITFKFDDYVA